MGVMRQDERKAFVNTGDSWGVISHMPVFWPTSCWPPIRELVLVVSESRCGVWLHDAKRFCPDLIVQPNPHSLWTSRQGIEPRFRFRMKEVSQGHLIVSA